MATNRTLTRNGLADADNKPATPKGKTEVNSALVKPQNAEPVNRSLAQPIVRGIGSIAPAELIKDKAVPLTDIEGDYLLFLSTEFKMFPPNDYNKSEHEVAIVSVKNIETGDMFNVLTENWIPFRQLKALHGHPDAYPFTGMFVRNPNNKNNAWEIMDIPADVEVSNPDVPF